MGTDVERIANGFREIHELWACPLDIGIAVYLLERQVGVACLVPTVIAIGMPCSVHFIQGKLATDWTSFHISHIQTIRSQQQVSATLDRKGRGTAAIDFLYAGKYQSYQDAGLIGEDLFCHPGIAAC